MKILAVAGFAFALMVAGCQSQQQKMAEVQKELLNRTDPFMGDWKGKLTTQEGVQKNISAQVLALGGGKYQANLLNELYVGLEPFAVLDCQASADTCIFNGQAAGTFYKGQAAGGKLNGVAKGAQNGAFELERTAIVSPTLGMEPSADAVVLFEGGNFDNWQTVPGKNVKDPSVVNWALADDIMIVVPKKGAIMTKGQFKDFKLHIEFRTPFMPEARGQARGNSGVYLLGRYEVQVLDSYGLEGKDNECGGIYKVSRPSVNACLPPMQWQTYDITFQAPRFDPLGKKISNAKISVSHNGINIQENIEIPAPTAAAVSSVEAESGPIMLQDHGNRVAYRNIWLVETK